MANGSVVKRLSSESVEILKQYDPTFTIGNQSPDCAIITMHSMIGNSDGAKPQMAIATPTPESPSAGKCQYDETRLLKRMSSVVQEACDIALRPYVS